MPNTLDKIEAQAMALNDHERAELADRLMESLASPKNPAAQAAWLTLAKKRRDEIRSGAVAGIAGQAGAAMVRKLVGR
jgi:hypothetical protein